MRESVGRGLASAAVAAALVLVLSGCDRPAGAAAPAPLAAGPGPLETLGQVEVTARLVDIPGAFPPNKLYDYVYVMKYQVLRTHRGKVEEPMILVGHYNPLKARACAQDKFSGKVGGSLERFRVGDVHRMALSAPLDQEMPMVGLIDKYAREKAPVRYWAIWTDPAAE